LVPASNAETGGHRIRRVPHQIFQHISGVQQTRCVIRGDRIRLNLTLLDNHIVPATDEGRGNPGSSSKIEQPHFAEGGDEKTKPHAQGQGPQRVLYQQSPGLPIGAPASRGLQVCVPSFCTLHAELSSVVSDQICEWREA